MGLVCEEVDLSNSEGEELMHGGLVWDCDVNRYCHK